MSSETRSAAVILMAEDDDDDFMLVEKAFKKARLDVLLHRVTDGESLLDYLTNRGNYKNVTRFPSPDIILLDLNMPRKDGREALRELKSEEQFQKIPVLVFTTSESDDDIGRSYGLGGNSFIRKPVTFEELVEIVKIIHAYWFGIVSLPKEKA